MNAKHALKAVFEANVVVSVLIFAFGPTSRLRAAWNTGAIIPLASRPTLQELLRVFAYPNFRLSERDTEELLSDYVPFLEMVDVPDLLARYTS
ncbi:MAG: PIN domain-containing protein [bacterium]